MSDTDNLPRLIGVTVVAIVGLLILFYILLYAFHFIGGPPKGIVSDMQDREKLNAALSDYQYKLDLVKEETQRLDMYYAAKASTEMSQVEFRSWLGTIKALTDEFISRENNATEAGRAYLAYLEPNGSEYNRVLQNEVVTTSDVKSVKDTYNGNAYLYNQQYGDAYGAIPYMS